MPNRREFLKAIALTGAAAVPASRAAADAVPSLNFGESGASDRAYWLKVVEKIGTPVLVNLARRELRAKMPLEGNGPKERALRCSYLEAFARLLVGIAPWLELQGTTGAEKLLQEKFAALAREGLNAATDPKSPDFMDFCKGAQALVDTGFLSQAFLQAPKALWEPLESRVKANVIKALQSSRARTPPASNWVLFAALVEAALLTFDQPTLESRLEHGLRKMLAWYRGDGAYGDGEFFRFDYYNSFVIQPALVDILNLLRQQDARFQTAFAAVLSRARRFAQVQERLIAPDGTFPSIGRSTVYRFGAFHCLAQMALMENLPAGVSAAQVRCALTAVIRRMVEMPNTFDENGWLRIGFCGHQPALGEGYISTGSLYLCSAGMLALGLPQTARFWSGAPARWTSQRLWSGENLPADSALHDEHLVVELPTLNRTATN
jgi:hypothetical protein